MNKYHLIILFFGVSKLSVLFGQSFGSLPFLEKQIPQYSIDRVLFNPVHNNLLISSRQLLYAGNKKVRGVCSWNGLIYDSLAGGINTHDLQINPNQANGIILGGINYNGRLLVGGTFLSIGGVNANGLATWDGVKWDSLPVRAFRYLDYQGSIFEFARYKNKLFLSGSFDTIQGKKALSLAIFDEVSFEPVNVPLNPSPTINSMVIYKNELYIGGNFSYIYDASHNDVLRYDGVNWKKVGSGIRGGFSGIGSMVVFRDELYVGGYFPKGAGNAGNIVMKWDGNQWYDVNWGQEYQNGAVWKLLVYHDRLYAFGTFELAGDKKASKIAAFDGFKWCTYADSIDANIFTADVYNDTIYIGGGFKSINGDTTKRRIAKLILPENFDDCELSGVGIRDIDSDDNLMVYPNPVNDKLQIELSDFKESNNLSLDILNSIGEKVMTLTCNDRINQFDIRDLPNGIYFLRFRDSETHKAIKIIKE